MTINMNKREIGKLTHTMKKVLESLLESPKTDSELFSIQNFSLDLLGKLRELDTIDHNGRSIYITSNGENMLKDIGPNICNMRYIMDKKEKEDIIEAHEHSINNKTALLKDKRCGCFFCLRIFSPKEITDWIDDDKTALCQHCSIDAIIGESSGFPITTEFLEKMRDYWF